MAETKSDPGACTGATLDLLASNQDSSTSLPSKKQRLKASSSPNIHLFWQGDQAMHVVKPHPKLKNGQKGFNLALKTAAEARTYARGTHALRGWPIIDELDGRNVVVPRKPLPRARIEQLADGQWKVSIANRPEHWIDCTMTFQDEQVALAFFARRQDAVRTYRVLELRHRMNGEVR